MTQALQAKARALVQGDDPDRINSALMQISRALVPADHTTGDRFSHDPALPQNPWPILDPIRALAKASTTEKPFATVDATRARNRMQHALRQAISAADSAHPPTLT